MTRSNSSFLLIVRKIEGSALLHLIRLCTNGFTIERSGRASVIRVSVLVSIHSIPKSSENVRAIVFVWDAFESELRCPIREFSRWAVVFLNSVDEAHPVRDEDMQ
jgi:hypothetical protein